MSSPHSEDFKDNLLNAKDRDLKPLLEESIDFLDLDYGQSVNMEGFLEAAWFSGTRTGHTQMYERALQGKHNIDPSRLAEIEAAFTGLMEESADTLNLSLPRTVHMWDIIGQAWIAGARSCETELMAMFIEMKSDVAREALDWLEEKGEPEP